jgi:hypothetical protein
MMTDSSNQSNGPVVTAQKDAVVIQIYRRGESYVKIIPLKRLIDIQN